MKVLIADDEAVSRRLLETHLHKWGFEVISTANGNDAWHYLHQKDAPRLMLLDWMMPGMQGIEISRAVRNRSPERVSYIILITSRGNKEDIVAGFEAGADDFIRKPFDADELHARIKAGQRILELQSALADRISALEEACSHIKTLQGILPLCMHCHKIRDDQEIWQRLEEYIIKHTDAMPSHSVCPECLEKYYADVTSVNGGPRRNNR